jgi:4'-phosphopantetheinyl transferase EntD
VPIHSQFAQDLSHPDSPVLSRGYASLFPEGVVAAEMRAAGDVSLLAPEEASIVASAVPKRVGEFAAGRLCARRALAEFGIENFALEAAGDRQPIWPEGFVGSITHTEGMYAAVVAERRLLRAIGVDTEAAESVKPELWPRILVAAEWQWLASLERAEHAAAATLIFSAKEAAYKCQYPLTGERLSFSDLEVTVTERGPERGVLQVMATRPLALSDSSPPRVLTGLYRRHEKFISAGIFLRTAGASSP